MCGVDAVVDAADTKSGSCVDRKRERAVVAEARVVMVTSGRR